MATEGKKTQAGRQTMTPYSGGEVAARALGFTPARDAEDGAKKAAFASQTSRAKGNRDAVVNGWVNANPQDKAKAYRAVQDWNKTASKDQRIEMKDLTSAASRRKKAGVGISTNKRTAPIKKTLDQVYGQ